MRDDSLIPVDLCLTDPAATLRAGRSLGRALPPRAVVLCAGELGAGKTTLIKAVCESLGIVPQTVISPTYTLVNVYPGRRSIYHVDLYRLESPEALLELDRDDWLNPDGPTFIEWPEAARPLLDGTPVLELTLAHVPGRPEARQLTARADNALYADALDALRAQSSPLASDPSPNPSAIP